MTTNDVSNYAIQQIEGPGLVVRHIRCFNPVLPTLPVYDAREPAVCGECGEAVDFMGAGDAYHPTYIAYQRWLQCEAARHDENRRREEERRRRDVGGP